MMPTAHDHEFQESHKPVIHARIPLAIVEDTKLSFPARVLFAELCARADHDWKCWHSVATLGEKIGASNRTIHRLLAELEKRGLIAHETRPGMSSIYRIKAHYRAVKMGAESGATPATDGRGGMTEMAEGSATGGRGRENEPMTQMAEGYDTDGRGGMTEMAEGSATGGRQSSNNKEPITRTNPPTGGAGGEREKPVRVDPKNPQHVAPALEDVLAVAEITGCRPEDAQDFHAHYTTNGWMLGNGLPMKNWHSGLQKWAASQAARRAKEDAHSQGPKPNFARL